MPKITKKFILFPLILIFSFFGLYFWYNQGEEVLAQGSPINCKKQQEVNLPLGVTFQLGPNELELPIGKATDETQETAEKINQELSKMITAAQAEIEAASTTIEYAGECSISNCTTPGCYEEPFDCNPHNCNPHDCGELYPRTCYDTCYDTCTRCIRPSCEGDACPHKTEMGNKVTEVEQKTEIIKNAYETINNLFTLRSDPPTGCWLEICLPPPALQNSACRTKIETTLDKLEKSRSGDYLGCGNVWIRQPSGLKDCVIRPEDEEAFLKGEKAGKLLLNCKEALRSGLINQESCYGMTACTAEKEKNNIILENCPRAENYYCCE